MPIATKPVTLYNNTIADALDVEAIVNVLYAVINALDFDNFNIDDQIVTLKTRKAKRPGDMDNIGFFITGTGNGTLTIKQANGDDFDDSDGNRGYVWLRSSTNGEIIRGVLISNISIPLVGMAPGMEAYGDRTDVILRIYAINDGNNSDDFTPKIGISYQGGFDYIRTTQGSTTASDIDVQYEVLLNSSVSNDNSPMSDIGYIIADFDDTGNINGENFWEITETHPGESADGIWQSCYHGESGFSVFPTVEERFTMIGKIVHFCYRAVTNGTSNLTSYIVGLPIFNGQQRVYFPLNVFLDNGVANTSLGSILVQSNAASISLMKIPNDTTSWTASGQKSANFSISYEAYQP